MRACVRACIFSIVTLEPLSTLCVSFFIYFCFIADNISILMYIMWAILRLFSALGFGTGALHISIIIIAECLMSWERLLLMCEKWISQQQKHKAWGKRPQVWGVRQKWLARALTWWRWGEAPTAGSDAAGNRPCQLGHLAGRRTDQRCRHGSSSRSAVAPGVSRWAG